MAHNPEEPRPTLGNIAFLVRLTGILMLTGAVYSAVMLVLMQQGMSPSPSRILGGVMGLGLLPIWRVTRQYGRRSPLWFGVGLIINMIVAAVFYLITSAVLGVN
jgi:hypothetical protein